MFGLPHTFYWPAVANGRLSSEILLSHSWWIFSLHTNRITCRQESWSPLGTDHYKTYGGGGGGVRSTKKKYSPKGKLNEKNSCTPINAKKIFMQWPKKIHTKNLIMKKIPAARKFLTPPPPITFLMVRPLVTVKRKQTSHLNFFNGTNQIYHADEKKKKHRILTKMKVN